MLILLPVDLGNLPFNVNPADCWIALALPFLWMSFVRDQKIIGLSYLIPIWMILVASIVSALAAFEPSRSLIVIIKELFLFVWFITMVIVFSRLDAQSLHLVLKVWSWVVILHGCLIVAQFLSPRIWQITSSLEGRSTAFVNYRPNGLFENANKAAFFQLFGFVPLLMARPARHVGMILGVLLLLTMLATGSMGAAVAFVVGITVLLMMVFWTGRLASIARILAQLAIIVLLLGGMFYLVASHNQRIQEHLRNILFGRSERSSGGRFELWQRGISAFADHNIFLWGIGPENFRTVDRGGKQLHNDFLAFSVERGLLGIAGLLLFVILALSRAAHIVRIYKKYPERAHLSVVVFLAAIVAAVVESLTHQVFHYHALWLVLALQEATLFRLTTPRQAAEPYAERVTAPSPRIPASDRYGGGMRDYAD